MVIKMGVNSLHTAALFFVGLNLLVCSFVKIIYAEEHTADQKNILSADTELASKHLPAEIFPAEIIELLSPEMLSQSDPIRYFLDKIIKIPIKEAIVTKNRLGKLLMFHHDKFPRDYLPYAMVLRNLLNCRCQLENAKKSIKKWHSSGLPYPTLPTGEYSPEFSELFASEVFSDDRPPFQLIIKFANIPMDKYEKIKTDFRDLYFNSALPVQYGVYAIELWPFLLNDSNIKWLSRSISILSEITPKNVSTPVPSSSADTKIEVELLPSDIFPVEITDILSPEIFKQSNPIRYLLEKIIDIPFKKTREIQNSLGNFMLYETEQIPSDYLPYADFLWNLLKVRCDLEDVKKYIVKLRSSSEFMYLPPPAGLFSRELYELFTMDIFSDDKPPFRLIMKLMDIPRNKIKDVSSEFKNLYSKGKMPDRYGKYSVELWPVIMNEFKIKRLLEGASKLRDIISGKFPSPYSQRSNGN